MRWILSKQPYSDDTALRLTIPTAVYMSMDANGTWIERPAPEPPPYKPPPEHTCARMKAEYTLREYVSISKPQGEDWEKAVWLMEVTDGECYQSHVVAIVCCPFCGEELSDAQSET